MQGLLAAFAVTICSAESPIHSSSSLFHNRLEPERVLAEIHNCAAATRRKCLWPDSNANHTHLTYFSVDFITRNRTSSQNEQ